MSRFNCLKESNDLKWTWRLFHKGPTGCWKLQSPMSSCQTIGLAAGKGLCEQRWLVLSLLYVIPSVLGEMFVKLDDLVTTIHTYSLLCNDIIVVLHLSLAISWFREMHKEISLLSIVKIFAVPSHKNQTYQTSVSNRNSTKSFTAVTLFIL